MKIVCPYKEEGRRRCVHKFNRSLGGKKKSCNYKFPHNCPYYVDSNTKLKNLAPRGLKMAENGYEIDDDD